MSTPATTESWITEARDERDKYKDLLERVSGILHQVTKDTDGIWTYLWAHSMEYKGTQYGEILKEIDKELGLEYPEDD